jgi:hypothetical protein
MCEMKLPNANKAVVEREKITDYLLNAAHRSGKRIKEKLRHA